MVNEFASNYCPDCGAPVAEGQNFCSACGTGIQNGAPLGYPISSSRIIFLTIISFGVYLFYWHYLTWRHYRDHTRNNVYPIWHALALLVPIYGLFRIHAHMRAFNELMSSAGLLSSIAAGWVVTLLLAAGIIDNVAANLTGGFGFSDYTDYSFGAALTAEILYAISLTMIAGVLLHSQSNLNLYWASLEDVRITASKVRVGEIVCSIMGVLAWSNTFASLLSASYRAA